MAEKKKRKMGFWEIAGGACAGDLQKDFEEAQRISIERGVPILCEFKILVTPPKADNPEYGAVQYQHQIKEPPIKSVPFVTEIKDGLIIKDGSDMTGILQIDMGLDGDKKTPVVPEGVAETILTPGGEKVNTKTGEISKGKRK